MCDALCSREQKLIHKTILPENATLDETAAEKDSGELLLDLAAKTKLPDGVPIPEQVSGMRQLLGLDGILAHAYSLQSEALEARNDDPKPKAHCPRGW